MSKHPEQLGFDDLLGAAAVENAAHAFAKETVHLPATMEEAILFHRHQIKQHHTAMLAADFDAAIAIRKDAHLLALKLNGGKHGIIAGEDAPGCVLERQTTATNGDTPLWGQSGGFEVAAAGTFAVIELSGMFGIGATAIPYVGFSARAKDRNAPFVSETGYRSFLGVSVPPRKGMTTAGFVRAVLETYVHNELGGKLLKVRPR